MKIILYVALLIRCMTVPVSIQCQTSVETEEGIYWQPHVVLEYSSFQAKSDSVCLRFNDLFGFNMAATIQINGVVDVPKSHLRKRIKKREGDDKAYLAPMFCKTCSCIISEDSFELAVTQLLFDVAEICSRGVRRELKDTKAQMNINNVNTMFFVTIKAAWVEKMKGTWASIYKDVLIDRKENSYAEWRSLIDELLKKNEELATELIEIERLVSGVPTVEGYVEPQTIMGNLK